jgi:hypothetical protein
MKKPHVRITVPGLMLALALISSVAGLVPHFAELGETAMLTCGAIALGSFFILLILLPFDPLLTKRRWRTSDSIAENASNAPIWPRVSLVQVMGFVAAAAIISWYGSVLGPIVWRLYHPPTNAEMAEQHRHEAVRWQRLGAEHPSLAKEYLRLAEKSSQAAERRDRMAKGSKP